MIPLARPVIPEAALPGIAAVLASGMLVEGARTRAFAAGLAAYAGARHALLVNSGTSALYLALRALGIGPGHAVLVPAYTFPATANAVAWAGAEPVFTDVDPATFNMDAAAIEACLARLKPAARRRIRAVMPVQAFGNPVDMAPILSLARRQGWKVIEDAACALGSTYRGKACGTHGDIGCLSFHPRKILTTGEGGAILTGSAKLAGKIALMKNHGMVPRKGRPTKGPASEGRASQGGSSQGRMAFLEPGLNLRFNEAAAVLGEAQLAVFEATLAERRALAAHYAEGLGRLGLPMQEVVPAGHPNWQALVARVPLKSGRAMDRLIGEMAARGVQANIGTYLVPGQPAYPSPGAHRLYPHAAVLAHQALALPIYSGLGADGVATVLKALEAALPAVRGQG